MTVICRRRVDDPSAWTGKGIGGKNGLVLTLTEPQLRAIDELLRKTADREPQQVTRAEFDHPDLTPFLADILNTILYGRGAVVIRGLSDEKYSAEELERIYWGFGTHWGHAVTQSALGDRLGRVTASPGDAIKNRGYRTNEELFLHTDANEIIGLLCLQSAESGGFTRLASATAIHNIILERFPEALKSLYEGYYYASREASGTQHEVTPYKIPIYCYVDGLLSCRYNGDHIDRAGEKVGPLPQDLVEARKIFHAVADEVGIEFVLEPGEMMVLNNFVTLHARTNFQDSATRKRSLLRLWLDVADGRKVIPEYKRQALTYDPNDERLKDRTTA